VNSYFGYFLGLANLTRSLRDMNIEIKKPSAGIQEKEEIDETKAP